MNEIVEKYVSRGIEQGMKKGMKQGRMEEKAQIASRMLHAGFTLYDLQHDGSLRS